MVVARDDEAHRRLSAMVKRRELDRALPGPGRGPPALALGDDRRAARPRPPRAREARCPRPRRPRRAHPLRRASSRCPPTPWSRPAWRPAALTRSACTSPRSAIRSPATPATAQPAATASSASSCTAPGSASSTRSRASGSSSSPRCRPTSPRRWSARGAEPGGIIAWCSERLGITLGVAAVVAAVGAAPRATRSRAHTRCGIRTAACGEDHPTGPPRFGADPLAVARRCAASARPG